MIGYRRMPLMIITGMDGVAEQKMVYFGWGWSSRVGGLLNVYHSQICQLQVVPEV